MEFRGLFENNGYRLRLSRRVPGYDDAVEARILIGDQVIVGDTKRVAEILWIGSRLDCAHGNDEPQAVSRSDIAATPAMHQRDAVLRSD